MLASIFNIISDEDSYDIHWTEMGLLWQDKPEKGRGVALPNARCKAKAFPCRLDSAGEGWSSYKHLYGFQTGSEYLITRLHQQKGTPPERTCFSLTVRTVGPVGVVCLGCLPGALSQRRRFWQRLDCQYSS